MKKSLFFMILWYIRWNGFFLSYLFPVHTLEKSMLHYIADFEANIWVSDQDFLNNISSHWCEVLRESDAPWVDHIYDLMGRHGRKTRSLIIIETNLSDLDLHGLLSERSESTQDFTYENAEAPNVCLVIIASPNENFGCRIRWCSTICPCFFIL